MLIQTTVRPSYIAVEVAAGLSVGRELLTLHFEHFITPRHVVKGSKAGKFKI